MPVITDSDTDPTSKFVGTLDSNAVKSFPSAEGSTPSTNQLKEGAHSLLSTTTVDNNSWTVAIGGDLTSEASAKEWREGGKTYPSAFGAWASGYAKVDYDKEIKFTLTPTKTDSGLSLISSAGIVAATVLASAF